MLCPGTVFWLMFGTAAWRSLCLPSAERALRSHLVLAEESHAAPSQKLHTSGNYCFYKRQKSGSELEDLDPFSDLPTNFLPENLGLITETHLEELVVTFCRCVDTLHWRCPAAGLVAGQSQHPLHGHGCPGLFLHEELELGW